MSPNIHPLVPFHCLILTVDVPEELYRKLSGTNDQFVPNKILDSNYLGFPHPWVDLYLGSYNSAQNLDGLKERGVTHILIAASGLSAHFPNDFSYKVGFSLLLC
jgi:hypothetical protein